MLRTQTNCTLHRSTKYCRLVKEENGRSIFGFENLNLVILPTLFKKGHVLDTVPEIAKQATVHQPHAPQTDVSVLLFVIFILTSFILVFLFCNVAWNLVHRKDFLLHKIGQHGAHLRKDNERVNYNAAIKSIPAQKKNSSALKKTIYIGSLRSMLLPKKFKWYTATSTTDSFCSSNRNFNWQIKCGSQNALK